VCLCAEVLPGCRRFESFVELGDMIDAETAEKVRRYIYSSGNIVILDELFCQQCRGRLYVEEEGIAWLSSSLSQLIYQTAFLLRINFRNLASCQGSRRSQLESHLSTGMPRFGSSLGCARWCTLQAAKQQMRQPITERACERVSREQQQCG